MNALTKDFTDAVEAQFGKLNKDVQDALTEAKTASAIILELEQRMVRHPGGETKEQSWGEQFVDSDGLKSFADHRESRPSRFRLDVKQITTIGGSGGRVEVSTEHADFFTRNLVAVRCEERIALAIKQAGALIYGDFGNVA